MDTVHWIITCGCGNPTEYYCNTCEEKLCSSCKETHLQNHDTKHHSVIEYTSKVMPGKMSSLICHNHNDKKCVYWCQTCKEPACFDCVTSSHKGHMFVNLETALQEKRTCLQNELEYLESNVLPKWEVQMAKASKAREDFVDQGKKILKELEDMAEQFHQKIKKILENNRQRLRELALPIFGSLREQEKTVSEGLEKVKQEIKECEDKLRGDDMKSVLEHEDINKKEDILSNVFSSSLPVVFIPSKIELVPRGIRGEKSSKDMASSRNLVSTIGALASPKMGDGTRCPEG